MKRPLFRALATGQWSGLLWGCGTITLAILVVLVLAVVAVLDHQRRLHREIMGNDLANLELGRSLNGPDTRYDIGFAFTGGNTKFYRARVTSGVANRLISELAGGHHEVDKKSAGWSGTNLDWWKPEQLPDARVFALDSGGSRYETIWISPSMGWIYVYFAGG